jgi:hypothetical protein
MAKKTSVYLNDELEQAVRDSGLPLTELVRRGLDRADPQAVRSGLRLLSTVAAQLADGYQLVPPER